MSKQGESSRSHMCTDQNEEILSYLGASNALTANSGWSVKDTLD